MFKLNANVSTRVWDEDGLIIAEINFKDKECLEIKKFQNLYIEKMKTMDNLDMIKCDGYPAELESSELFFEKYQFGVAKKLLEELQKEFSESEKYPGILASLFRTAKYHKYQEGLQVRAEKEKMIDNMFSFSLCVSKNRRQILCYSKIHTQEALRTEIEKTIELLKI